MSLSLVAYGDSSGSESEPEDGPVSRSNNQSAKEDVRKLLSVLPAPRGGGKGSKQPVRIGLPQLDKGVSSPRPCLPDNRLTGGHYLETALN